MIERSSRAPVGSERDEFTGAEAQALGAWRALEPPPGFSERVMARARADRAAVPPLRGLAVAALALVVIGGLFSVQVLFGARQGGDLGGGGPAAGGAARGSGGAVTQDAGPRPEVRGALDGLEPPPS